MEKNRQLAVNSLGIGESILMGVAGSAPAFSLAAATSALIAAVHLLAPASIVYSGLIMFGITLSFIHLNKVLVNAGASYAWVSDIFGPTWGFFAGWSLLVASSLFMVAGSVPAATATLLIIAPQHVDNLFWVTGIAALWVTFISAITSKGIKPSAYLQILMTGIELLILLAIIIAGFIHLSGAPAHSFSWTWLELFQFTPQSFASGALIAIFLYWGWDVTLNLNEETKGAAHTPGWGAFWSVLIIILLLASFVVVALLTLTDQEIQKAGTNIIFAVADKLFPRPWSHLAVLCVVLSTIGTLETNILQFTRTLFAQSRDGVMHIRYATLHSEWNTPWLANLAVWIFGILFLALASFSSTVLLLMHDSVNAVSFQVAFYYSLTGFACGWYYRTRWTTLSDLITVVIWPMLSALFLVFIALYSIPTFDALTLTIGIGGIGIGIVPFLINRTTGSK